VAETGRDAAEHPGAAWRAPGPAGASPPPVASGGAFRRAAADPLRPARVFLPFFAVAAVVFLLGGLGVGLSALSAQREVLASATGPALTLPAGSGGSLVLYGAAADGSRPPAPRECRLTTSGRASARYTVLSGQVVVDGRTLHRAGEVTAGWRAGDVVTCTGFARLAATTGGGPLLRLALAGLLLAGALTSTVLVLLGRSSARARARSQARSQTRPSAPGDALHGDGSSPA